MKSAHKWIIAVALTVLGVFLCTIGFGFAIYYWKEQVPNHEAGALSSLQTLHTIQENYKKDKGFYAASFRELGTPLGATLDGDDLSWKEYHYQLRELRRDSSGRVIEYAISARPARYRFGHKKSFLEDQRGAIFVTKQDRPANRSDRIIPAD